MNPNPADLRQRLLEAQPMPPALRASYQAQIEELLHPKLTVRAALPGIVLLLLMLACVGGIVRNLFVSDPKPLVLVSWTVLVAACGVAGFLIVRDLWRRTHSRTAVGTIANTLTVAAGTLTVAALLQGLAAPDVAASTFNAFFAFVFYFACVTWAMDTRIAAAELAAREQMLRIEYRLADLAERVPRGTG